MPNYVDNNAAARQNILLISQSGVFLAVLLALQVLGLPNPVTGVLVNAILVFVSLRLGMRYALILATLSPVGGIISGHLPAPLYPLLPVIVCGNFVLIIAYRFFMGHSLMLRLIFPAFCKGLLIGGAGIMIIKILSIGEKAGWFLWPVLGMQFFTALAGIIFGERLFARLDEEKYSQFRTARG